MFPPFPRATRNPLRTFEAEASAAGQFASLPAAGEFEKMIFSIISTWRMEFSRLPIVPNAAFVTVMFGLPKTGRLTKLYAVARDPTLFFRASGRISQGP